MILGDIDERNGVETVCRVRRTVRIDSIVAVTVVGNDDDLIPVLESRFDHLVRTLIDGLDRFLDSRIYEFARKGDSVELKPKLLVIDEIEVLSFDPSQMQLTIRVVCSKGTYIRALARDIGERLGSGAYLTALRRTRVGNTRVEDCFTIAQFLEKLTTND